MANLQSRSKTKGAQLRYKVSIVGLGAIGQDYDYELPLNDASRVQTHAAAFSKHSGFELIWAVDPVADARMRFENKYQVRAWRELSDVPLSAIDVVVICTPTTSHYAIFTEILKLRPRLILLEKPISESLENARNMLASAKVQNCAVAVNYIRRFEPGSNELRKRLRNHEFGNIRKAIVWYAKGLLNNASHFINLCEYWFGAHEKITILKTGRTLENSDCEPDFLIQFGGVDVYFISGHEEDFSLKEMQILTENGMIEYKNGGEIIQYYQTTNSAAFAQYKVLAQEPHQISTDFARYQKYTADAIYEYLKHGVAVQSDGASALSTQTIIEEIRTARNVGVSS